MKKYHAHRIDKWIYEYRGFRIECVGYYNPDHKIAWEAIDKKMDMDLRMHLH